MTSESNGRGFGPILGTFVLGAAVGAVIALLTASRSGRETRERLKSKALDLGKTLQDLPDTMRKAGTRAVKAGHAAFDQARDEVVRGADNS
jgi:gas vesicle protein